MKKTSITIFVSLFFSATTFSQQITKQEKGYFNLTEIGYFTGNNKIELQSAIGKSYIENSAHALSIRNINGWFITNKVSAGIGIGLDGYTQNNNRYAFDNTFLIFADARYYLENKSNTFFGFGDLGSSVEIDDNIKKGLFYNIGLGYKFKVAKTVAMNFSIGYNYQGIINKDNFISKESYSSLAVKLGLLF